MDFLSGLFVGAVLGVLSYEFLREWRRRPPGRRGPNRGPLTIGRK